MNWIATALFVVSECGKWADTSHRLPAWVTPTILSWITWLGGWEVLAFVFFGVGVVRIILAPYWLWQSAQGSSSVNHYKCIMGILTSVVVKGLELERDYFSDHEPTDEALTEWTRQIGEALSEAQLGDEYLVRIANARSEGVYIGHNLDFAERVNRLKAVNGTLVQFIEEFSAKIRRLS